MFRAFSLIAPRVIKGVSVAKAAPVTNYNSVRTKASILSLNEKGQFYEEPEYNDEYQQKLKEFFDRPDIDSWEIRQLINRMQKMDFIPEPYVVIAALKAARRLNDYAIAVRYLEAIKHKCGPYQKTIYPWLIQEIRPTLDELGIDTPEDLGYDEPELYMKCVHEMHDK